MKNDNIRLSKDFKLSEYVVSNSYPELLENVYLSQLQIEKIYLLNILFMQPIRNHFGPTIITSGFRTKELNDKLSKTKDSQHLYGEAVDFLCPKVEPEHVWRFVIERLDWPGEFIWYRSEKRFHVALPSINVKSDRIVLGDT